MWITPNNERVGDNDAYIGTDGTRYPANFPKGQIAELAPLTLVQKPTCNPMTQEIVELPDEQVGGVWTQRWGVVAMSEECIRACAKNARDAFLNTLKVTTTSGKTFDGNELSATRIIGAIKSMEISGRTERQWTLADTEAGEGQRVTVTLAEMREALVLIDDAITAEWPLP